MSSDDNHIRVWRSHGECLNTALALQGHTAPTAGVIVWSAIAYDTLSPLILFHCTMTAKWYIHDILQPHMAGLPGAIFQHNAQPHTERISQDCLCHITILTLPAQSPDLSPIKISGMASWTTYEFGRSRGAFTATAELDVSGHHTELTFSIRGKHSWRLTKWISDRKIHYRADIHQVLEKTRELGIDTHHLFIDFKTAYDSFNRKALIAAWKEFKIPDRPSSTHYEDLSTFVLLQQCLSRR
ncbi:transposable element Tcb2 transposase [Trichonephila clavipes]|uniref:Transposable element Tcb2 transposase n=1 Tax=Trichonephila clavipes TaxID=2585209 RepID=A0A8X6VVM9_TRICX|nr:transposable element Tcb2 transposase [Trichonephila clavipes]